MMGIDIYGWIEIKDSLEDVWVGVAKIDSSVILDDRNKAMHTFLFSTYTNYKNAIAPKRGIPDNVSEEFKQLEIQYRGHSHSWIGWSELKDIEWLERNVDELQITERYILADAKSEVMLTGGWNLIFDLMGTLSKYHSIDRVRLVVGFL